MANLGAGDEASVAGSHGQALLNSFWGGYVAALSGSDCVRVLRDPSGNFPCYCSTWAGLALFASDADLIVAATAGPVPIDFDEIGRQLYRAFVPAPMTALGNIRELL